jgi:hypothetical protein
MMCEHSVFITETAPYGVCTSDENKVRAIVYKKKAACKNFKRKEVKEDGKNK